MAEWLRLSAVLMVVGLNLGFGQQMTGQVFLSTQL